MRYNSVVRVVILHSMEVYHDFLPLVNGQTAGAFCPYAKVFCAFVRILSGITIFICNDFANQEIAEVKNFFA